jgi:ABC-type transport system involved in multi-copper enzyme maturation permease subunit
MMQHAAYLYYAYRRTLSYPVVRVYFITLIMIALLILLFVQIEVADERVTGFSIFGESMHAVPAIDRLLKSFTDFISYVLLFALIVGTAGIFPDMMRRGAIEINLTIGFSRSYIMLGQVIGTILCVAILTLIPSVAILGAVFVKTGAIYPGIIGYCMFFALSFGILFCWIALLSILTNNTAAASIVTLGYVYFLEYYIARGEIIPHVTVGGTEQIIALIHNALPRISDILDLGLYLAFGIALAEVSPLFYSFLTSVAVVVLATLYFRKIDF